MLGIMPSVEESTVLALAETVLKILAMLGILADPTTAGISDSAQAMTYLKPKE
jgi:phi LC3 family holin